MKIRTGFVSNSSSSSFVVAFPYKPKSVEDLKTMMFGKQEWHYTGIYGAKDQDAPTQRIAESVFADIEKKATKKEVFESIRNGWFTPYLIPELFPGHQMAETSHLSYQKEDERKEIDKIYKENDKINNQRAKAIADAFVDGHKDKYIVVLSYCDEDGEWQSILEHSGIFHRLDHIITSYH
jgi:hypothetical protein